MQKETEMMDETALPKVETMPANQPDSEEAAPQATGEAGEAPFLTVRYNKEERPLTREAAAEFAQKGLNYDKVSGRLAEVSQKLSEYGELEALARGYAQRRGLPDSEAVGALKASLAGDAQDMVGTQLKAFMKAFPDENPRALPDAVMDSWKRGVPLSEAYLSYKAAELEKQLKSHEANTHNAAMSMGGAIGTGDAAQKPLSDDAIARMSPAELERNHSRIWAYLTGKKD
jgi:hypothetical protein